MTHAKRLTALLAVLLIFILMCTASAENTSRARIQQLSDLAGKTVAIQTGTIHDALLESIDSLKGNLTFNYYNAPTDMIEAVKTGKADAAMLDKPVAQIFASKNPELMALPSDLDVSGYGIGFQKGSALIKPLNEALDQLKEQGILDDLEAKWTGADESAKKLIEQDWDAINGTLRYWVDTTYEPISYIGDNGAMLGYDLDMMLYAARIMGYHVEITSCNFDGLIPALISGKADMIGSGLGITPERAESINFSEPYYMSSVYLVVANPDYRAGSNTPSFWDTIGDSFYKTFIKESRWKMFAEGVGNTLLITVMSALLGTALGFAIYMLCRSSAPIVTKGFEVVFSLLERMPIIVFLMVLYYIICGNLDVSGVIVSIAAFTLTFSASMYGMLKTGVSAVSIGQTEAAYALGYNKRDAFFKIVLPQAARFFIPSYRSELISLVKGTAVVGYIAVQDLTKMSDIVRSRTYEAFFPLITTAIIYVVLTWLLTLLINKLEANLDPKRRKAEKILKGVEVK